VINITKTTRNSNTDIALKRFPLLYTFFKFWDGCSEAFVQKRTHQLGQDIALGLLTAFGRRTITRGICAIARQFVDWTKYYRFFSKDKWSPIILRQKLLEYLSVHLTQLFVRGNCKFTITIDDTIARPASRLPGPSSRRAIKRYSASPRTEAMIIRRC